MRCTGYWVLFLLPGIALAQSFTLGTSTVTVGAAAGNASVELLAPSPGAPWTAASNSGWLHVAPASASGAGSGLVLFSYDPNSGTGAQSGTLTIAGQTLTVVQSGSGFATVSGLVPLAGQGLSKPFAVALDNAGKVYIADAWNNTVSQWSPLTQQLTTLISSGLNRPHGIAVDGQGNLYIADTYNNAIEEWNPGTQQLTALVSSGILSPMAVAVDWQGNVYIADFGHNAVEEWNPTNGLTPLVSTGLHGPTGVAVDLLGNVYIADFGNNALKQWNAVNQVTTLVGTGLSFPNAVAVDGQGNVYVVDGNHNTLVEWNAATQTTSTLISSGINGSFGVATDGQGSFYIANTSTSTILKYSSGYSGLGVTSISEGAQAGVDFVPVLNLGPSQPLTAASDESWLIITGTSASAINFSFQANTSATPRTAHITALGQQVTVTQGGDAPANIIKSAGDGQYAVPGQLYAVALQVTVTDGAGNPVQGAAVTFSVTPGATGAGATFSSSPPMPIVTNGNGNATAPALAANSVGGQFTVLASMGASTVIFTLTNSGSSFGLGAGSVVVGNTGGSGSVLLIANGPWTASSNTGWLQLSAGSASGFGNALIQFTYTANSNANAQTGTLTIAGQTFTVIQAGTSYVSTALVTTLLSGLNAPRGVGLDLYNNVYVADSGNSVIREWNATTQQVTAPVSSGLNHPAGVALDSSGNIYIADSGNNAIEEWNTTGQSLATLVPGLSSPSGVALDRLGNVYFSNTGQNAIEQWTAANTQVNSLAGTGLSGPTGVAVDAQGNVYFADTGDNAIKEWNFVNQVTLLPRTGFSGPSGVAVDGDGNVYIADTGNNALKEWNAGTQQVTTLPVSGLSSPAGVAVDPQDNLYVADTGNGAVKKITLAYISLSATGRTESAPAGSDSVTVQVLPASITVTATSDQPWLVIASVSSGTINFTYSANISVANRTAHIGVLGQTVTVTQNADAAATLTKSAGDAQTTAVGQPYASALQVTVTDGGGNPLPGVGVTFNVVPGATGAAGTFAGTSTVSVVTDGSGHATALVLTANTVAGAFTVTATVNGLAVTFSLTNLVYALDGSSVTVGSSAGSGSVGLLAGGSWTALSNASWLQVSTGTASGSGNALIQFTYSANSGTASRTGIVMISGLTFTVTQAGTSYAPVNVVQSLVSTGLKSPQGVAVDQHGNVYIADTGDNAIKEWVAGTGPLNTLVSGLNAPTAVAVDRSGNVYFADSGNNAIKEWNVTKNAATVLVGSGIASPNGVAVDSQGNVYFSDTGHNDIKEWVASSNSVTNLVTTGLSSPRGVAVDLLGNVYFADTGHNAIKEWIALTKAVNTLPPTGLNAPRGVGLDAAGNVYIADSANNAIKEWIPGSSTTTTLLATGIKYPSGVAVDTLGNVYIADTNDSAMKELTDGYLAFGSTSRTELAPAGTDSVAVLTIPAGLPFTATSNTGWLKITGTTGGAVAFSYTANTAATSRTSQVTVLGQVLTVTQNGDTPASITIVAGNNQSAAPNKAFARALEVQVKDAAGSAISGASVTFTVVPGSNGAGGSFASSAAVLTTAGGYATASTLTTNGIAGTFTVTATAGGVSVIFHLTIT